MFGWIIGSSLPFQFLVLAIAAALLIFGTEQLRRIPVDVFPEFAPPKVEIQTQGPGMTAAEVEELITIPMEQSLRGVPGLDIIRSKSARALSQAVLLFKPGVDLIEARQNVQELMNVMIAGLPQLFGHVDHAAAPVVDQPGHEDRHHVEDWG